MKKLVTAVFAVALLACAAVSASAYEFTIGGNIGLDYTSKSLMDGESATFFSIAPEFAKIVNEDTNIGIGLSYGTGDYPINLSLLSSKFPPLPIISIPKVTTFGGYLFAEKAVLSQGSFKVFIRGDIGYSNWKLDMMDDSLHMFSIGIAPNIQYGMTDRLTLTVSSNVLRLGFDYGEMDGNSASMFGFNSGTGAVTAVALKYAF